MNNTEQPTPLGRNDELSPTVERDPIERDFEYLSKNFNGALLSFMMNLLPGEDGHELKSLLLDSVTGWRTTNRVLHTDGFAAENAYDQTRGEIGGRMSAEAMRESWIPMFIEEVEITLGKYSDHPELKAHLVDLRDFVKFWEPKGIRYTFLGSPELEEPVTQDGTVLQRSVRVIQRRIQDKIQHLLNSRYPTPVSGPTLTWGGEPSELYELVDLLIDKGWVPLDSSGTQRLSKAAVARKVHAMFTFQSGKTIGEDTAVAYLKSGGNRPPSRKVGLFKIDETPGNREE